jgi:ribosome-associated toxin RatA of RatAB toxin-antitoxin module
VTLDATAQSGRASATLKIRARREVVFALIKSCAETIRMVPGLIACDVLETAPDQSWQRIRHVLDYSWLLPKLTYELRATYDYPAHIAIERVSGDFRVLNGSWELQSDGANTVAHYAVELAPNFWVPRWVAKLALKHDLPKMLRALQARAESMPK